MHSDLMSGCVCVCVCVCIGFLLYMIKMNRSTKRSVIFKELFIHFLHTCMFPTCCFHQRTYVAQGHVNRHSWDLNSLMLLVESFQVYMGLYRGHSSLSQRVSILSLYIYIYILYILIYIYICVCVCVCK